METDLSDSPPIKRRSIWRTILKVTLVVLAIVALRIGWLLAPALLSGHPRVTVSEETTYVLGPLRDDGYVDYVAAFNEIGKEGITHENNAAVPLIEVMGDVESVGDDDTTERKLFEAMEITPLPNEQRYKHLQTFIPKNTPRKPSDSDREQEIYENQEIAQARPWSKEEFPVIYEWITANSEAIDRIAEGTTRSRYCTPMLPHPEDGDPSLLSLHMVCVGAAKEAGRALRARAMLRARLGNIDQARDDLLACHRLGRLASQESSLVEWLVGIAIERDAIRSDCALVHYASVEPKWILDFRNRLRNLPTVPSLARGFQGERLVMLDVICGMARGRTGDESAIIPWYVALDYDLMLRELNDVYDDLEAVCSIDDRAERDTEIQRINSELESRRSEQDSIIKRLVGRSREDVSRRIANVYLGLMVPSLEVAARSLDGQKMSMEMVDCAMAMAQYRADHGKYPETLNDLVPKHLEAIPQDVLTREPIRYRREGDGFLLWSVGDDGIDDDGNSEYDTVLRMPVRDEDHRY